MGITFTNWDEWKDILAKMQDGLVRCPDCGEWVSNLLKIPERYRNLYYTSALRRFEEYSKYMPSEIERLRSLQEIETYRETKEYCCDYCMAARASTRSGYEWSERFDKCSGCGEWFDKGLVKPFSVRLNTTRQNLCSGCRDKARLEYQEYKRNGKERQRVAVQNDRARRLGLVADLTVDEWLAVIKEHNNRCKYCGGGWTDMEHVVPVSQGGGTTKSNVVTSCRSCNTRKMREDRLKQGLLVPRQYMYADR
jgi:5-methylcytosine-specific restriction endonuclease McrA